MCACARARVYIFVRARVYLSVFLQRGRREGVVVVALARRLMTYPRPPSYSPLPSTRPRSAAEQPSIRTLVCTAGGERGGGGGTPGMREGERWIEGWMQRVAERCERVYTRLSLSLSFLSPFLRLPLSLFPVICARFSPWTRPPSLPSSVIWTLRRVIRNCMSST